MSAEKILLNDVLRIPVSDAVKAKFSKYNGYSDPIDDYLIDPDYANSSWLSWRGKRGDFRVGQIVLHFMRIPMRGGSYLLTAVRKVTSDTGIAESHAYTTEDIPEYKKYCGRIIIEEPNPPIGLQYIQYFSSVVERLYIKTLLPTQYSGEAFPGVTNIQNVKLTELRSYKKSNRLDWIAPLSNQKGIYLLTDTETKKKYIGSAYGEWGLWQRWMCYIDTDGSGGNRELHKLVRENPDYGNQHFEFSVLETFGSATDDQTIINREQWWKRTLHSELNAN